MKRYIPWLIGVILPAAFLIALPFSITIVPIEQVEAMQESEAFDAVAYVDGIWQSQIVPAVLENAVDLQTILSAIEKEVLEPLDKANLVGKQLEFYGATSIRTFNLVNVDLSEITIVPVQISVME
ncbi:MAG: DUF2291 family protein [Caldilineaceae bacterium]|nr:DUF2291 family protein [Caldilineaceae bacterium]